MSATVALSPALADAGLPPEAFRAEENGAPRAADVGRLAGDELEAVLVIDTSGSMSGAPMAAAKSAANAFLAQVPASARVAVVGFGDTPVLASPLTTDRAALTAAIDGLRAAGETALYDGALLGLDQFDGRERIRRHVVLLSDGGDTASTAVLGAVHGRLAGSDVRLDVAELATAESQHETLVSLAGAGRGSVVSAADPSALTPIYGGLARGLANQFVIQVPMTGHGPSKLRLIVEHGGQRAVVDTTVELPAVSPTPAPAAPAAAGPVEAPAATGLLSGPRALALGAVLCFAALLLAVSPVMRRRARASAWRRRAEPTSLPALATMTQRAVDVTDNALERHGQRSGMSAALERAGVALRPGEFLLAMTSVATGGFVAGLALSGLILAAALALAIVLVARLSVTFLADRRQKKFQAQLGDNLQLMAGSLRSGYAVLQAVDAVAREAEEPSAQEFRRVILETRLGRDVNASLRAMAERVGGEDVEWVAQAIEINREVGGDLSQVLDNIASTIRERDRVRRQVQALTAEGRISAYVLVALPLLLGAALSVVNPGYLAELRSGTGLILSGVGVAMLAAGSFWMSRMVKVEY